MNPSEKILRRLIQTNKAPCVQYTIFNSNEIIFQFSDGFADISKQIKVNEHTAFHTYSVTKTLTALAVLQLTEQKKFGIFEPIKKYLPVFLYPENITIKQLLTHSAGIPNPI